MVAASLAAATAALFIRRAYRERSLMMGAFGVLVACIAVSFIAAAA